MCPSAPRPPRPASSPSSSVSSGSSGSFHRERERSPRTPLPPPALMPVPRPVHHVPRTPMMDARRYRSLFPRRRVAPPTPPPSNDEPSEERVDPEAEFWRVILRSPILLATFTLVVAMCMRLMLPTVRSRRVLVLVLDLLTTTCLTVRPVVVLLVMERPLVARPVTFHQTTIWRTATLPEHFLSLRGGVVATQLGHSAS
ncbi:hypothetical protein PIB30_022757 [Stylosanthes scabra]|uniref:Uncharacterized protein n=1 Tax=Stylosanthes scabra TaxID=79078 RepID=A0ABU6R9V6_9FABA|nr:hypothetical protein [Stylosanthes scabra]